MLRINKLYLALYEASFEKNILAHDRKMWYNWHYLYDFCYCFICFDVIKHSVKKMFSGGYNGV